MPWYDLYLTVILTWLMLHLPKLIQDSSNDQHQEVTLVTLNWIQKQNDSNWLGQNEDRFEMTLLQLQLQIK